MKKITTTKHFESLSDEEKNKIMFVIHGCLFEDGQAQEQIFFEDASDESKTAEKANWILKDWMGVEVELGPKSISKLLKLNGEMF